MRIELRVIYGWFPALKGIFTTEAAQEFDSLLERYLEQCVEDMEAEAHLLHPDSEEKLSAFLGARLSHPGLDVRREAYTNGRVDLTIRQQGVIGGQVRLAEAKIYDGPAYHTEALEQLVIRYSTGRPPTGYVIEYFKKAAIATLVQGLRQHADQYLPVQQEGSTEDHPIKWAYQSQHRHSSSDLLRVVHVNVNLYRPLRAEPLQAVGTDRPSD